MRTRRRQVATNTDVIRGTYEAFARRHMDVVLARFAPDIEVVTPSGSTGGAGSTTYKGHDEVDGYFAMLDERFGYDFTIDAEEYVESGSRVVVFGRHTMRSPSLALVTIPFVHSWTLSGGKVTRLEEFYDTAYAGSQLMGSHLPAPRREPAPGVEGGSGRGSGDVEWAVKISAGRRQQRRPVRRTPVAYATMVSFPGGSERIGGGEWFSPCRVPSHGGY
jgi:ketosteroid isomerase-like protein